MNAYVYLVKIPSSNDLVACAYKDVLKRDTQVMMPTRYGMDLGVVVGPLSDNDRDCPPCGNPNVLGSCHFEHVLDQPAEEADAVGYEQDGEVIMQTLEGRTDLGTAIRDSSFSIVYGDIDELEAKEPVDEYGLWDEAYAMPQPTEVDGDVTWISHVANADEKRKYRENCALEIQAVRTCREKIARHGLEMKLVSSHFLVGEPKALFFFTADARVDFRALVKDLVSLFRMRIELRQIGVRDEARMLGGLAVCGRDLCCHCVSDKLNPVTIKMAKEQNLSLNSMKISGPCGRLLCCLGYEHEFYCEEKQAYPAEGSRLKIGEDLCRVQEVNILSKKVTVSGPEGTSITIPRSELSYNGSKDRWEVSFAFQKSFLNN